MQIKRISDFSNTVELVLAELIFLLMKFIKLKEQSKIRPRLTTDCDKGMDEPLIKMQ